MANAASPSIYEILSITKNGVEIDLKGKTTTFDYYESLLSPNVTATMTYVDTGHSIEGNNITDRQQRRGTIYNTLPITGEEQIRFKIRSKLGTLDFSRNPLLVNSTTNLGQESQRESVGLNLISNEGLKNLSIPLNKKYNGSISNSAIKILKDEFGLTGDKIKVDPTRYAYSFVGAGESPFENLLNLASKATPAGKGNPGYFFYQTQDGFNFRSIDQLISQPVKQTYYSSGAFKSSVSDDSNDVKIIKYTVVKNQDIINALKTGVYISRNIFFDPRTFKYVEKVYRLSNKGLETSLGSNAYIPKNTASYSRVHQHILDVGFYDSGVSFETNNDPINYQAQATMRYNLLVSQVILMMVPCNPNLRAGDTIRCEFEKITGDSKDMGSFDENQSGKYLILNLRHNFSTKQSYTALTLVRDSYGIYTNKNKG